MIRGHNRAPGGTIMIMRRAAAAIAVLLASLCASACSGSGPSIPPDASADTDAAISQPPDAAPQPACAPYGAPGVCITTTACAALGDHSSYPGSCPGAADVQCCIDTPDVADNPPTPAGYRLMKPADVTPAMTDWAIAILHDATTYPMFSTTMRAFGAVTTLARVEWHPPDLNNGAIHRGVTLYGPIP